MSTPCGGADLASAAAEAVRFTSDLIRIDTTNTGDDDSRGEREAAEYVVGLLEDVGYEPVYVESRPRRANVFLRIAGADPSRSALVVHGHLDVVPADPHEWTVDPFSGAIEDGMAWGRGAVDMKDMDAMMIACVRDMAVNGWCPARDLVVAFFADEESSGTWGSEWCVRNRPDLFAGATEAIGEVGGFSTTVAGRRAYLVQTAEKGLMWLRLIMRGTAGHGSAANSDNAVTHLADAVARLAAHRWPRDMMPAVDTLLRGVADLVGRPYSDDPATIDALVDALGPARRFVAPSLGTALNPTGLQAGCKANVVPSHAEATMDVRPLPGQEDHALAVVADVLGERGHVEILHRGIGVEAPFDVPLVDAMAAALGRADPDAVVLPYLLPAGTDAKSLAALGIRGYGFVPLRLPADFDFTAMFHGVDERVPVGAIEFGTRVLADFLATAG
ncbi:MAG: M20/M25/M40 family metallo-hydrolase [Bifidobacteriaceae bacterium]|nr:M20/M25/M40 family metallo-hydrolase [Bifidobacteriaceae bacterium]